MKITINGKVFRFTDVDLAALNGILIDVMPMTEKYNHKLDKTEYIDNPDGTRRIVSTVTTEWQ